MDSENIKRSFGSETKLLADLDMRMIQKGSSLEEFCKYDTNNERKRKIQENKNEGKKDRENLENKKEGTPFEEAGFFGPKDTANIIDNAPNFYKKSNYTESTDSSMSPFPIPPPSSFQVELFVKRKVKVTWEMPELLLETEEIQNYWLEYKKQGKDWERICLDPNVFAYTFSELHYLTTYKFKISASFGKEKQSLWSKEETCSTKQLNAPFIVKVTCCPLSTLLLLN